MTTGSEPRGGPGSGPGRDRPLRFAALRTPAGNIDPRVIAALIGLPLLVVGLLGGLSPFEAGDQVTGT